MRPLLDVEPVRTIQRSYFDLLRGFFGHLYEEMQKHQLSPGQIAGDVSRHPSVVQAFHDERYQLVQAFAEFWNANDLSVNTYLRRAEIMKSFFGGDISPNVGLNHLSSTLIYTDTVVLQCPVLRLIPIIEVGSPTEAFRLVIKHALNVMRFEELALADVEPPILLVTGSAFAIDESYRKKLVEDTEVYELAQAKALLGKEFANSEEFKKYALGLKTAEDAIGAITNPSRALFDTDWVGSLAEQFNRQSEDVAGTFQLPDGVNLPGFTLYNLVSGRMLQANEIVLLNSSIGATPLLSAPTSWQYLLWRYEFDAEATAKGVNPHDLLITNAILTRDDRAEIPLVSGLSLKNIVALRKEGAMSSLRELMRNSVKRIDSASQKDLKQVSQEVSRELSEAFDAHDRELSALSAGKKRFYGVDVAPTIVSGGITIAGAATGNIPLTTVGALSTLIIGGKSLLALKETWKDLRSRELQIKRSPTAILLRTDE